jgi:LuxR family maltose regulon positive regulatory protein
VLLEQARLTEAMDLLERLREVLEDAGYGGPLIEILALQALGYRRQRRDEEALVSLERAARRAEPEGYVRTFLDHGSPMLELLRTLEPRSASRSYLHALLAHFGALASGGADGAEWPGGSPYLVEPLSEREKEILHLIAAGHSNNDIAAVLTVAASTVKWHVKQIYGKLGVHNRVQAVGRGREAGLLR